MLGFLSSGLFKAKFAAPARMAGLCSVMIISIIVAAAANDVIGRQNDLPWRLSADLQQFKRLTMGHAVVMGRKTYESIGRPLPGRRMIVITRQPNYAADGVEVVSSLPAALELAERQGETDLFIIGGAEIFAHFLPRVNRLYWTRVHANVDGDVRFPAFDRREWRLVESTRHEADAKNEHPYSFELYERVP
jgi:dihydrofolate reductase